MFQNIDILKILGIGLSGFCFLLVLLTFFLLRAEQKREADPRPLIITMIWRFMIMVTFLVIVVGLISLPVFSDNNRKETQIAETHEQIQKQDSTIKVIVTENINENTAAIKENQEAIDELVNTGQGDFDKKETDRIIKDQRLKLQKISVNLKATNADAADVKKIDSIKNDILDKYKIIANPDLDKAEKQKANTAIKLLNDSISRFSKKLIIKRSNP